MLSKENTSLVAEPIPDEISQVSNLYQALWQSSTAQTSSWVKTRRHAQPYTDSCWELKDVGNTLGLPTTPTLGTCRDSCSSQLGHRTDRSPGFCSSVQKAPRSGVQPGQGANGRARTDTAPRWTPPVGQKARVQDGSARQHFFVNMCVCVCVCVCMCVNTQPE